MMPQEKLVPYKTYRIIHYSNDLLCPHIEKEKQNLCLALSYELISPFKMVLNWNLTNERYSGIWGLLINESY